MSDATPTRLRRLQKRAEELLIEGHRDRQVVALLERIADEAEDHSEPALFAHRQLAELRLEDSPWRAALHLRRLTAAGVDDDGVFALLGLCHALMGNFRTSVSSYRRALRMSPENPWYHHNLGHLLDVGLGTPESALAHLREAHRLEPTEDEVVASLAHCLARLGQLEEAGVLAAEAIARAPRNSEHRALQRWIADGAKDGDCPSPMRAQVRPGGAACPPLTMASPARGTTADSVVTAAQNALRKQMPHGGFDATEVDAACALLVDYARARDLSHAKAAVLAAAVEYAMAKILSRPSTQNDLGSRYEVGKGSISSRYRQLVETLRLSPFDPRYLPN